LRSERQSRFSASPDFFAEPTDEIGGGGSPHAVLFPSSPLGGERIKVRGDAAGIGSLEYCLSIGSTGRGRDVQLPRVGWQGNNPPNRKLVAGASSLCRQSPLQTAIALHHSHYVLALFPLLIPHCSFGDVCDHSAFPGIAADDRIR